MSKRPLACLTIARNEAFWLPRWLAHYGATGASLRVLDHESDDGSTRDIPAEVVPISRPETDDVGWMLQTVEAHFAALCRDYERVVFAEVDEFLVPDPRFHASLKTYLANSPAATITATGYDICQRGSDPPLDPTRPLMGQRGWKRRPLFDKTLVSRRPLRWEPGFHRTHGAEGVDQTPDPTLLLLHFHYADFGVQRGRLQRRRAGRAAAPGSWGFQNKFGTPEAFEADFWGHTADAEEIPPPFRSLM